MFCIKCGKHLPDDSNFCPYCGYNIGHVEQITESVQNQTVIPTPTAFEQPLQQTFATPIPPHTMIMQQTQAQSAKPQSIKALRVLSVIGFVLFPLGLFGTSEIIDEDTLFVFILLYFGFAVAHAIVGLVQANKHKLKATKVMAIIGIVWYVLSVIFVFAFMYEEWVASQGWIALGMVYAIAFSIVGFVQSRKETG